MSNKSVDKALCVCYCKRIGHLTKGPAAVYSITTNSKQHKRKSTVAVDTTPQQSINAAISDISFFEHLAQPLSPKAAYAAKKESHHG